MPRPRTWTDRDFEIAVVSSSSLLEIAHRLGIQHGGPTNKMIRAKAKELDLELPDDPRFRHKNLEEDLDNATKFLLRFAPERISPKWRTYFEQDESA